MSDTVAAVGDVIEGAMVAGAVERGAGADGHFHEAACLNCGTVLVGRHCHGCGQAAHVHRTLAAFFHDLLHGLFHFEGKVWRTIPMLVWRPGRLTREYIDGRRASYVSPIALFLFSVFLTFAAFNLAMGPNNFVELQKDGAGAPTMAKAKAKLAARIAGLEADRAKAVAAKRDTTSFDEELAAERDAQAQLAKAPKDVKVVVGSGGTATDKAMAARIEAAIARFKANPELMALRLEGNAHKYSWLLIPLSVPFVWLLFPFSRRFRLYDHTVFVTYSLTFLMLIQVAMVLVGLAGADWLVGVIALYVPVHLYRQVKDTYGLTRRGALWRSAVLAVSAVVVLMVWLAAMLGLLVVE